MMKFTERIKSPNIENIMTSPFVIIGLIFLSLLFFQIYLKLSPIFLLAAFFGLTLVFFLITKPEIGLLIFIIYVLARISFFQDLPRLGFISISVLMEALLVMAVLFKIFVKKESLVNEEIPFKIVGLYLLCILLSSYFAYINDSLRMKDVKILFIPFLAAFLIFTLMQHKRNIRNLIYASIAANILILISTMLAIFGIIEVEEKTYGNVRRLTGFIQDPNDLSFHLISFLIISFSLFISFRRKILKASFLILSSLNLTAILYTLSRGGFITLIGVLLVLYLKFTRNLKVFLILLLLSFFLYLIIPEALMERFSDVKRYEETSRYIMLKAGLKMTLDNPIFGVGPGNFSYYSKRYTKGEFYKYYTRGSAHNLYVSLSGQYGIPALILYLLIFIIIWRKLTLIENYYRGKSLKQDFELLIPFIIKINFINIFLMGLSLHIEHSFIVMFYLGLSLSFIKIIADEKGKLK